MSETHRARLRRAAAIILIFGSLVPGGRALAAEELRTRLLSECTEGVLSQDTAAWRSEWEALQAELSEKYPLTEIMFNNGLQPVYDYIIVLC